MEDRKTETLTIRLTPDLDLAAAAEAKARECSKSAVVRLAFKEWLAWKSTQARAVPARSA